jgi:hypothetical protein
VKRDGVDWEEVLLDLALIVGWGFFFGHLLLACSNPSL